MEKVAGQSGGIDSCRSEMGAGWARRLEMRACTSSDFCNGMLGLNEVNLSVAE